MKNNKTSYIQIRVTDEEKKKIKEIAKKENVSVSKLLRKFLDDI